MLATQPDEFTDLEQQLLDDLSSSLSGSDAITMCSNLTVLWSELWHQAGASGDIASQLDRILQVGTVELSTDSVLQVCTECYV